MSPQRADVDVRRQNFLDYIVRRLKWYCPRCSASFVVPDDLPRFTYRCMFCGEVSGEADYES